MKTIKSFIIISLVTTLAIFCIGACRTKKGGITKFRNSEQSADNINIHSKTNDSYQGNRMIVMKDSASLQYRIKIVPLDTFSFSSEHGFKGRAQSIEIAGAVQNNKQNSDWQTFSAVKRNDIIYNQESRVEKTQTSLTKAVKKRSWPLLPVLISIFIAALCLYAYKKFIKSML